MFTVEPLPGPLGARILGLYVTQSLSRDAVRELLYVFYEHRFIVIPAQNPTMDRFEKFGAHFGVPHLHVIKQARLREHPSIIHLTNVMKNGQDYPQGAAHWHTDQSYEAEPSSATILYAVNVPREGGETLIADMFAAYDGLTDAMKQRIEGLEVEHLYGRGVAYQETDYVPAKLRGQAQVDAVPAVRHLLARPHPVTGRVALYSPAGTSRRIIGMEEERSTALLRELATHALQDKYIYKHNYTVGDVVAWDNSSTMHAAEPIQAATGPEDTRLLYRISVKGIPAVYREFSLLNNSIM